MRSYNAAVSFILVALIGVFVGFLVRRWFVLVAGVALGAGVLLAAAVQRQSLADTPAIFVALLAIAALGAGVALGRRSGSQIGSAENR